MKSLLPTLLLGLGLSASLQGASIIHSWDFEGDYNDDIGGANASVTGSTTVGSTTGFNGGTAATFQASASTNGNATVNTPVSPAITTPISGFSITYWVKMADDGLATAAGNRGFFDFSANGTDSGYQGLYQGATNKLNFRVDNGNGTANVVFLSSTGVVIEDDAWHHIAVTFNPGQSTGGFLAYLDGLALTDTNAGDTTGFTTGDIDAIGDVAGGSAYLGAFNLTAAASTKGLNGALDDFQIWSGVLTPAEISALASIPEPTTTLLGLLGSLALLRRRR